ncbi:30S ribosomal protein S17 [Patescibacteria group bacterium AH-259-L05]|nr:30S ribosomal protein S17 [Patescibacteria group bacterium AH-259-L05]
MNKRQFQGKVVSDKMDKTIVVKVERIKMHPLYKKRYRVHKKYKVHDAHNKAVVGDTVIFEECRPLSKHKKWRLIKIIT